MAKVGIIGAKGYTAGETLRWILRHPKMELACLMARVESPEPMEKYFSWSRGMVPVQIEPMDLDLFAKKCEIAFLSLPHTTSQEYAPKLIEAGVKVVDLSADFRFDSVETFEKIYAVKHLAPQLNAKFPYAQPELFGSELRGAAGLACPGCYPTATMLGLAPIMTLGDQFDLDHVVTNALSGVSGAGRKLEEAYLFVEANESLSAYSVGKHRHRPEIEEKLARLAGRSVKMTFTTHLMPINRGILATTTVPMTKAISTDDANAIYKKFYDAKPFVRVLPSGKTPATADVFMSNFCDIGVVADSHSGVLIIVSAIDNLAKGASSQAIQATNLMMGWPETTGLIPDPVK